MVFFQPVTLYAFHKHFFLNWKYKWHKNADGLTKIKNREITGNCIWKPHLGNLSGSGNLDEFQLQVNSCLQDSESLNFFLLMKILISMFILLHIKSDLYTLTSTLDKTVSLAYKKVTKPDSAFTGFGQNWRFFPLGLECCRFSTLQRANTLKNFSKGHMPAVPFYPI